MRRKSKPCEGNGGDEESGSRIMLGLDILGKILLLAVFCFSIGYVSYNTGRDSSIHEICRNMGYTHHETVGEGGFLCYTPEHRR